MVGCRYSQRAGPAIVPSWLHPNPLPGGGDWSRVWKKLSKKMLKGRQDGAFYVHPYKPPPDGSVLLDNGDFVLSMICDGKPTYHMISVYPNDRAEVNKRQLNIEIYELPEVSSMACFCSPCPQCAAPLPTRPGGRRGSATRSCPG